MKFSFKRKMYPYLLLGTALLTVLSSKAEAQDNLETIVRDMLINEYPVTYIQSYLQPFATAFGTTVIGGIYHGAYAKEFPHSDLGIKAIKMQIPEDEKFFSYEDQKLPTVFGPATNDSSSAPGTGLDNYVLPLFQANIGMFSGFEIMVRANKYNIPELGKMDFFGLGVRYGLSDIIPVTVIPIDMSVQVIYHTYSMGEWLNSGTFAMNLQTSTELSAIPLTIYGGIGYESTSLKLTTEEISDIGNYAVGDISINGKNKTRATIGAAISLFIFNVHAEYNFGKYPSAAAGALVVF